MNISVHHSTPNRGLSATNQASRESGGSQKFLQMRDSCPRCGSTSFSAGAGRKPGEMSLRCSECKAFIGYRDVGKLQRLQKMRGQKRITDSLEFVGENSGLTSDEAIFLLSEVEQLGGAS